MFAPSHRSQLVGFAAALLLSCSSTQTLEAPGICIEGQSTGCMCSDGAQGFRTCGRGNDYGACDCSGQPSSGSGGMQSTGGIAGLGGSSGVGGAAGAAGSNPVAGSGGVSGMAGVGGSAGSTVGGAGGMIGGMTGGSAGVSGASGEGGGGGIGGASPMGGQSGGGDGGDGGNSGPGRDPKPGELYGDCHDDGACDDTLLCVNDSSSGLTETYCTTTCDALNGMSCPRARGERMAICLFGICVR